MVILDALSLFKFLHGRLMNLWCGCIAVSAAWCMVVKWCTINRSLMRVQILLKQHALVCKPAMWRLREIRACTDTSQLIQHVCSVGPIASQILHKSGGVNCIYVYKGVTMKSKLQCTGTSAPAWLLLHVLSPCSILLPHSSYYACISSWKCCTYLKKKCSQFSF